MLSGASTEGHELVMLTLRKEHPKPLSFLNQSLAAVLLMPGPCAHNASQLPCTFAVFEEHNPNFASWDPTDSELFKNKQKGTP